MCKKSELKATFSIFTMFHYCAVHSKKDIHSYCHTPSRHGQWWRQKMVMKSVFGKFFIMQYLSFLRPFHQIQMLIVLNWVFSRSEILCLSYFCCLFSLLVCLQWPCKSIRPCPSEIFCLSYFCCLFSLLICMQWLSKTSTLHTVKYSLSLYIRAMHWDRIFHFGRVCWSWKATAYIPTERTSNKNSWDRIFYLGRVWWSWKANQQRQRERSFMIFSS